MSAGEWYEVEVQNRGTGEWVSVIARDGKQMPLNEARRLSEKFRFLVTRIVRARADGSREVVG